MAEPLALSTDGDSYGDFFIASWLGLRATAGMANTFVNALRSAPVNDTDQSLDSMSPDERNMLLVVCRITTPMF